MLLDSVFEIVRAVGIAIMVVITIVVKIRIVF